MVYVVLCIVCNLLLTLQSEGRPFWTAAAWPLANQESCTSHFESHIGLNTEYKQNWGNPGSLGETLHSALPEVPFTVLFPRSAEALGCGYASLPMLTSWLLNWQLWPPAPDLPSLQNLLLNHLNMFLPSHSIWETHTPWHPSPLFPLTYNSFVKYALNAALCIHSLTPFQFLLYPRLWWSLQQACSPSHTKFMSVITASASQPVIKVLLHCHSQIHNGWK